MGFCLFNNIAITARALTSVGEKVAIVDWDVHHGNGTQESFFADPNVLYISLHESGFYPGTGHQHERGEGSGQGSTINFPLPAGTGGDVYRWLMHWAIRPAVETFAPDWLLISAGYDAHVDDPLAGMSLTAEDYAGMASSLRETVPASRTAFFLEGGYDLAALTASTAATLRGCHGEAPGPPAESDTGTGRGWPEALDAIGSRRREEGQGSVG
jgi:acetoin utilization deacetylase AcuC-like enzyme